MAAKTPLAFLSYAHFDDAYENGKLRTFAERLSGEVQLQWGEEFPIFIDRNDLKWGQQWKVRIDESLDGATFLIPILTPGYFKSEWCRKEFFRFRERERKLQRADFILLVYYVRSPVLEEETKRAVDEIARVLSERQYQDWRSLRHEPWTTPEVGRRFEQMALQIIEALERGGVARPVETVAPGFADPVSETLMSAVAPVTGEKSQRTEPPTLVVDAMHRGDYTTISEAIVNAKAGTRILVRPGHYREGLVIQKPLEILGEGNRDDIVVEALGKNALVFEASMSRVSNLTLRQSGVGDWYAVDIVQGRLDLEDCDVTSRSLSVIGIHGGAEPRVRRNRIHDGKGAGILVYENGAGLIEDNEIFANALPGIEITTGGSPTVRRNRIRDGKTSGVLVHKKGAGLIEDNDITSNAYYGIGVTAGGNPSVIGNRISGNREGIRVYKAGLGTFDRNVLKENQRGAWDIAPDCLPNVKHSGNTPEP